MVKNNTPQDLPVNDEEEEEEDKAPLSLTPPVDLDPVDEKDLTPMVKRELVDGRKKVPATFEEALNNCVQSASTARWDMVYAAEHALREFAKSGNTNKLNVFMDFLEKSKIGNMRSYRIWVQKFAPSLDLEGGNFVNNKASGKTFKDVNLTGAFAIAFFDVSPPKREETVLNGGDVIKLFEKDIKKVQHHGNTSVALQIGAIMSKALEEARKLA